MTSLAVGRVRCEHLVDPVIDIAVPRLSWDVTSSRNGCRQVAHRILVTDGDRVTVWDSGRVGSTDGVLHEYGGRPLASRERVAWTVQVWDDEGGTAVSDPATWEAGLLELDDWQARWVTAPWPRAGAERESVTYLRRTFSVPDPAGVGRARLYATALGLYDVHLNGARVGDRHLTPGWTDYPKRLQYQVTDIGPLLVEGDNVVEARLADGWYAGWIGFVDSREHYGTTPQFLAQLEIDEAVVATDGSWVAGRGPLGRSDMLMGEHLDRRIIPGPWEPAALGDGMAAVPVPVGPDAEPTAPGDLVWSRPRLVTSPGPPVVVLQQRRPVSVERMALPLPHAVHPITGRPIDPVIAPPQVQGHQGVSGPIVDRIDLGQNIAGWVRLRLDGPAGTTVTVRHGEVVDEDGTLHTANLRTARAADTYVLDGTGPQWFEPALTFHGFRFADVSGSATPLTADDVFGVVVGSDVEVTGSFGCGDPRINRLHDNIEWGARGNFVDIPTDCPQRDERMGWMGDAQVFAPTAGYLFDTDALFTKWLDDVTDGQSDEGAFPDVAPRCVDVRDGAPGWGDAGVLVPWMLLPRSGDRRRLARLYPSMRAWVGYIHDANPDLLWRERRNNDIGDWLSVEADSDKELVATAFFARSTRTVARTATLLGLPDAAALDGLADDIAAAFAAAYLRPDGSLSSPTQTAYALALRFGLLPEGDRDAALVHLVADIEARDHHLSTGFLGVAHLLPALTDGGRIDVAYRLLLQDTWPSWLHPVAAGATTVWERWNGWTADGGLFEPSMSSFNHYAFGAVGEWLYRTAAGIEVEPSSWGRHVTVAPHPHAALGFVRARTRCATGFVTVEWVMDDGGAAFDLTVRIPVGAAATLRLPGSGDDRHLDSGTHTVAGECPDH